MDTIMYIMLLWISHFNGNFREQSKYSYLDVDSKGEELIWDLTKLLI